ncbi:MAG: lipopolysaccharide heptosyltransferase I [Burkholderiales bacterium]
MTRILLVRLSSLGDVVHTFPAVTDIARHVLDVELHWAVDELFAELPALHPAVSRVIPVALRRGRRNPFSPATWRALAELRATLATPYDAILDLQGLLKSAVVARLVRGPRHGHASATARERLATWLYDHRHSAPRGDHAVAQTRRLAAAALGYEVDGAIDYGMRVPARPSFAPTGRYAVLLHSTSRASKLWAADDWIALGQRFESADLRCVLPWGNESERIRAEQLVREIDQAIVAPRMSLTEAAGLLGRAQVVVGLDTGLTHLAAAMRTPVVGIYCDTSPADLRPIGPGPTASCGDRGRPPSLAEVAAAVDVVAPGLL